MIIPKEIFLDCKETFSDAFIVKPFITCVRILKHIKYDCLVWLHYVSLFKLIYLFVCQLYHLSIREFRVHLNFQKPESLRLSSVPADAS